MPSTTTAERIQINGDYQWAEHWAGYDALGSGTEAALGALYATRGDPDTRRRVELAVMAAATHAVGVSEPLVIEWV